MELQPRTRESRSRTASSGQRQAAQLHAACVHPQHRTVFVPVAKHDAFGGRAVELEAMALNQAAGPLFLRDGEPFVRWSYSLGGEMTMNLNDYLRDRVELLADPPEGT